MPRKTIDLSDNAFKIYKAVQRDDRSKYVSEAIVEKHNRDTTTGIRFNEAEKEWIRQEITRKEEWE
jgi:hypothetical protein